MQFIYLKMNTSHAKGNFALTDEFDFQHLIYWLLSVGGCNTYSDIMFNLQSLKNILN